MTEIEKQALELLNGPESPYYYNEDDHPVTVLARAIEQHEQFKREVSDAVEQHIRRTDEDCSSNWRSVTRGNLSRFILPKPVDPLVEAWDEAWVELSDKPAKLETFRAALAKRGGKIVWENEP